MSNTIKLKTGSGSDPSASDLIVGEIAIRTDSGKLFTKKDNGSVAEISGGGGIEDGDKGDITVSNGGDTFTIDSGVINNAKVASDAAIAGSKISPTFTSDLTVEHTGDPTILIHDTSANNQCRVQFQTDNYSWVSGLHGGQNQFKISNNSTFGTNDYLIVDSSGNLTISNNIVVGGTVDGRDLATDGSKLDGIESGATADQTASDIKTLLNSSGLVNAQIDASAAIAGSKIDADFGSQAISTTGTGSTLGRLTISNANPFITLTDTNNDSDFSIRGASGNFIIRDDTNGAARVTVNSSGTVDVAGNLDVGAGLDVTGNISCTGTVDGRDLATDGTKLDGIASGATNVTNTNQLTNGAGFITATLTNEQVQDIVGGMLTGNTETGITVTYQDSDGTIDFVVGTLNQDTTGNAATATALETARNIGGVSFDGTGNINLPGVNTSGNQNTSGNAATATKLATARTIAGVSFDGSANISLNNNAITNGAGYITTVADTTIAPSTIDMEDDERIKLGASDDLQIYHDGTDSFIRHDGTGTLKIQTGSSAEDIMIQGGRDVYIQVGDSDGEETAIRCIDNGGVEIYHDNSKKAETVSGGFTVTGTCTATTFSGSGASLTSIPAGNLTGTLPAIDGSNLTGISAGATGGGSDEVFYENDQTVTTNYTITNGKNAMAAGPIEIQNGVTVTVGSGETLTIV